MSDVAEIVARELDKRGWTLASANQAFLHKVRGELEPSHASPEEAPAEAVRRATIRCYARLLFEQCGEDGTSQQQTAFRELRKNLFPRAMFWLHDRIQADDAAQKALTKIYRKRLTCREPGNFIKWCHRVLFRLILDEYRERYIECLTERGVEYAAREVGFYDPGDTVNEESNPEDNAVADPQQDTLHAAMTQPMRAALIAALQDCLGDDRQAEVIGQLFINDKTFAQVAEQLHTTPVNVQVIRHRALKKLRDCAEMQRLVEDWDYQ